MANQGEVKSLMELPKYKARTIDITPALNFSNFELVAEDVEIIDVYLRMARCIGHYFNDQGLVEIVAEVLTVPPLPTTYQVHVHGRNSETGQRYSAFLM